jgi:hypothetical protein
LIMTQFAFSDEYIRWNARLLDFALLNGVDDGRFFLTVRQMLEDESDSTVAEHRFVRAVAREYSALLKRTADVFFGLKGRTDAEGRPLCVAALGLTVLAAEQMDNVAYYKHLAEALEQPQEGSGVRGFFGHSFEAAWIELDAHLRRKCGCALERPRRNALRYVGWPRMHALLRFVDTAKLPDFFYWAGLSPARSVSETEFARLFLTWVSLSGCSFTLPGRAACRNEVSRGGVVRQSLRIFEMWNGEFSSYIGGSSAAPASRIRTADASLIADVRANEVRLTLCVPRPKGFPERIAVMGATLRAFGDDEYEEMRLPRDWARALASGIIGDVERGKRFRLKGAAAYPLIDPEKQGRYQSQTALRLGVRCGALCLSRCADKVENYLQKICRRAPKRMEAGLNCEGWTLFHDFVPLSAGVKPPRDFELLAVENAALIRPVGGLRLGRAQQWMHGAPPHRIEASINGTAHALAESCHDLFEETGFYAIVAGGQRYSLQIIEPRICMANCADVFAAAVTEDDRDAILPSPEENSASALRSAPILTFGMNAVFIGPASLSLSARAAAPFPAQWAIGTVEGRLSVIALNLKPAPPRPFGKVSRAWAKRVLQARSARIGVFTAEKVGERDMALITATWRAYLATALAAEKRCVECFRR